MYGTKANKYFELVMDETAAHMTVDNEQSKELGKAVRNLILDTGGPTTISKAVSSREDIFVANKIFRPMSEIIKTIEAIENISVYIKTFPYRKYQISNLSYLQYHVENYLNEVYILKNRLISYLNILEKSYGKSEIKNEIPKTVKPLYTQISTAFKGYVNVRGSHVHELRFSNKEFDRLSTLELFSRSKDSFGNISRFYYQEGYRKLRRKWTNKIKLDIQVIHKLLDNYFEQLSSILFKNGKLVIPKNYSKQ